MGPVSEKINRRRFFGFMAAVGAVFVSKQKKKPAGVEVPHVSVEKFKDDYVLSCVYRTEDGPWKLKGMRLDA